ncbi:MAG TPA: RNA methyltransferase [Gemmatimonadaceae bacterium]|jgi:TrmH family RNA methyltransferase|nr:RNA methyltransferase [Gemmatimonadaceae bacterium]
MKLLTLARDLRRRKARERQRLFIAEGVRTVEELSRSALEIKGVLTGPGLAADPRGLAIADDLRRRGVLVEGVDHREFESAAETESPQGILAVAAIPAGSLDDLPENGSLRLLILDAVQDPGNVGTILRTAAALGASATYSLPGTVDLWNSKVVRSGMGAHFHHRCLSGSWDELEAFRRDRGLVIWAADASGESIAGLAAPSRLGLVVGNEGGGLSVSTRDGADRLVALSIASMVESLNVAVAAGILLYELRR